MNQTPYISYLGSALEFSTVALQSRIKIRCWVSYFIRALKLDLIIPEQVGINSTFHLTVDIKFSF